MNKNLFERYAYLKNIISEAETELESLKEQITAEMGDTEEVETDWGVFVVGRRRTWSYPVSIVEAEANLKQAKKTAEQVGDATYVEKPYLIFKSKNEETSIG